MFWRKKITILLAEDNDINARLARAVLTLYGAEVVHARNGADAHTLARDALAGSRRFHLVLMDIHMPDMGGIEAAGRIRALYRAEAVPGVERPPIVALTANGLPEDRAAYLAAGLDDYLAKPFDKKDLAALIERWLGDPSRRGGEPSPKPDVFSGSRSGFPQPVT